MAKRPKKVVEPTAAEELRAIRAGLLSIDSVLHAAHSPERISSDGEDKAEWLTWLTLSGEFGDSAKTDFPILFNTVLSTGVSVIAQRGKFHTQYYLPGTKEGIRISTRISIDGLQLPKPSIKMNPFWWWKSPNYLKILQAVRDAVQERLAGYEALMIRKEAAKAAFAAAQAANICISFVSDWMKEEELRNPGEDLVKSAMKVFDMPKESLIKCTPAFAEFGIDLPMLILKFGFRSSLIEKLGIQPLPVDAILLGAALDNITAKQNYNPKSILGEDKN